MILKDYKKHFLSELEGQYPETETLSFFNLLAEDILGFSRVDIVMEANSEINDAQLIKWQHALEDLKTYRPLQYIIGSTEFYSLPFNLNKHTLIPRPETEELVAWILESVTDKQEKISILDIGTGSGCIAISLAKNLVNAQVTAYDISEEALIIARSNAILNNVSVTFKLMDILTATTLAQKFDIIVSNPPYVRDLEKKEIQKNVLEHEPHTALFVADNEPLIFYDKITALAKNHLKPTGRLFFEINQYLGKETKTLVQKYGFKEVTLKKDIFNADRMLGAKLVNGE
ncbi:MAG: protein-(glutamine-N5) methyltransferase, release factor-specific [Flavobacteriaceae bacterium]|nr:MAG: protein-(glutamine-N5) methyltransferase, release factor-specific [Flavobacteriaceae bacterium]